MPRLQSFPILQCSYFRLRTVSDVPFTPLSHFHSSTSSSCWLSLPLPYHWQQKILSTQVSASFIQCSNSKQSENKTFLFSRLWMEPKIGIFWLRVHMCLCHWSLDENNWLWGDFAPRVLLTGIVERHGHARRLLRHQLLHHGHAVRLLYDQIYTSL